jgi:hypothetical protein
MAPRAAPTAHGSRPSISCLRRTTVGGPAVTTEHSKPGQYLTGTQDRTFSTIVIVYQLSRFLLNLIMSGHTNKYQCTQQTLQKRLSLPLLGYLNFLLFIVVPVILRQQQRYNFRKK